MAEQRSSKKPAAKAKAAPSPTPDPIKAALEEAELTGKASELWGDQEYLDRKLLRKLYPLLRAPIPAAYIQTVAAVKGKPYESTGIKSVQVQVDRLNNVLGLDNWRDNFSYFNDGRLCHVVISVLGAPIEDSNDREILVMRSSYGGVEQGSTAGNIHKGSYTNAAKLAIARLGPGADVYLGVADMDPDVSQEIATATGKGEVGQAKPESEVVKPEQVTHLRNLWRQSGVDDKVWKTFLASRKKKEVAEFNMDDFQAAVAFLAESGIDEEGNE